MTASQAPASNRQGCLMLLGILAAFTISITLWISASNTGSADKWLGVGGIECIDGTPTGNRDLAPDFAQECAAVKANAERQRKWRPLLFGLAIVTTAGSIVLVVAIRQHNLSKAA